jgi:hypothetical protein
MNVGTPASWSQLTENTFRQGFFQPNSRESYWLAKGLDGSHWGSLLLAKSGTTSFHFKCKACCQPGILLYLGGSIYVSVVVKEVAVL